MTHRVPPRPPLTLNRRFVHDFLAEQAPCCALGMIEEGQQRFAALALRPQVSIPPGITARGFNLGHSLLGTSTYEVIHFAFEFYGFDIYNVLLNPTNALVQAVVGSMVEHGNYFILVIGLDQAVTAFRADFSPHDGIGLKATLPRLLRSTTTATQYQQALSQFRRQPYPVGSLLAWVCRDQRGYLDPTQDPLALSPTADQPKTLSVTAEHRALAEALDARVQALERTGVHDLELFIPMADHMPLFKQLLDTTGADGMAFLGNAYAGLYRYAKLLERIATGLQAGDIEAPH